MPRKPLGWSRARRPVTRGLPFRWDALRTRFTEKERKLLPTRDSAKPQVRGHFPGLLQLKEPGRNGLIIRRSQVRVLAGPPTKGLRGERQVAVKAAPEGKNGSHKSFAN